MSPIAIALDVLLVLLLLGALGMGWRLNGRLKALRASQHDFAQAVTELNTAAARAEGGLSALRAASQEAHDSLLARIDTARALAVKLEKAEAGAEAAARRAEAAVAELKSVPPPPPARIDYRHDHRAEPRAAAATGPASPTAPQALSRPAARRRPAADEALFADVEPSKNTPREAAPEAEPVATVRPSLQGLMRLSLAARR